MKREVEAAIAAGIHHRREMLRGLTDEVRTALLEDLFLDLFGRQHLLLQKWGSLTGQSAQVDTGYIAQFVASLMLREPGQGFRGKGDDLADGSEVKGAANISGVDRPRWNHNLGTPAEDAGRRSKGERTKSEGYLTSPFVFYLLADRPQVLPRPLPLRLRAWCINGQLDTAWRNMVTNFVAQRKTAQYNLQLHPPVGYDDDVVVNTLGNLDFAGTKCLEAWLTIDNPGSPALEWKQKPIPLIHLGRALTNAMPYTSRPSRLTDAEDIVADIALLPSLFPGILTTRQEIAIIQAGLDDIEERN